MADFEKLENVINRIASGFEKSCMDCLQENNIEVADLVREQLYSGLDGNTDSLRPGYSEDPYFRETTSMWHNDPDGYIEWKRKITPPIKSPRLNLPPRPVDVPNLYITVRSMKVSAHLLQVTLFRLILWDSLMVRHSKKIRE